MESRVCHLRQSALLLLHPSQPSAVQPPLRHAVQQLSWTSLSLRTNATAPRSQRVHSGHSPHSRRAAAHGLASVEHGEHGGGGGWGGAGLRAPVSCASRDSLRPLQCGASDIAADHRAPRCASHLVRPLIALSATRSQSVGPLAHRTTVARSARLRLILWPCGVACRSLLP